MSEHLSEHTQKQYRLRKMSPADLLAADDHLAQCEACRRAGEAGSTAAALLSLRASLQAEAASLESDHLAYEQIAALVDNELDATDREIVESHLELCATCTDEVDDLRDFRATLELSPEHKSARLSVPTVWERFVAFWPLPTNWSPLRLATALVVVAFVFVMAAVVLRQPGRAPQTELAQAPRPAVETLPEAQPGGQRDNAAPASSASPAPAPPGNPKPSQTESPGDASRTAIALNDGGRLVTQNQQGEIEGLGRLPPASQRAVKEALTSGRVETPLGFAGLTVKAAKPARLMGPKGEDDAFALLSPVGRVVRSNRPTLRWRPLSGATGYTVAILDSDFNPVVKSPPLSMTEWTPPTALERGRIYSWQVTAVRDGKELVSPAAPAPEARFKVLEKVMADELERTERVYPDSRLALGVLYAQAGLLEDAEQEFRALLKANPKSLIARKLLQSVLRRRRG